MKGGDFESLTIGEFRKAKRKLEEDLRDAVDKIVAIRDSGDVMSSDGVKLSEFLDRILSGEFPPDNNIRTGTAEEVEGYRHAKSGPYMPAYRVVDIGDWHLIYANDGMVPIHGDVTIVRPREKICDKHGRIFNKYFEKFKTHIPLATFLEAIKTEGGGVMAA